jgi:murein DD-endopeptidase MepM/ murein hydrolase activator NlpD
VGQKEEQIKTFRRLAVLVLVCIIFVISGVTVSASSPVIKHKDISRLSAGLKSVKESAKKAHSRLLALKKREVFLRAKVEEAGAQSNSNDEGSLAVTIDSAQEELSKIRFERKALIKKVRTCELNQRCIIAEMALITNLPGDEPTKEEILFERPVGGRITSSFGSRIHPIEQTEKPHQGIDLAGAIGDAVKSTANGKVIFAGVQRGYGKIVIIQHSDDLQSAYAHLSQMNVEVGEAVAVGQKIGAVGMTGNSTGPHLHFEIRLNGEQVDPTKYL